MNTPNASQSKPSLISYKLTTAKVIQGESSLVRTEPQPAYQPRRLFRSILFAITEYDRQVRHLLPVVEQALNNPAPKPHAITDAALSPLPPAHQPAPPLPHARRYPGSKACLPEAEPDSYPGAMQATAGQTVSPSKPRCSKLQTVQGDIRAVKRRNSSFMFSFWNSRTSGICREMSCSKVFAPSRIMLTTAELRETVL